MCPARCSSFRHRFCMGRAAEHPKIEQPMCADMTSQESTSERPDDEPPTSAAEENEWVQLVEDLHLGHEPEQEPVDNSEKTPDCEPEHGGKHAHGEPSGTATASSSDSQSQATPTPDGHREDGPTEKPAPTPPEASNMPGVETGASAAMAPPSAHCYVVWKTDTTTDIRGIHTGGYAAWDFIRNHLPGQKYDKTARLKRCETLPAAFVLYASEQRRHESPISPRVWNH